MRTLMRISLPSPPPLLPTSNRCCTAEQHRRLLQEPMSAWRAARGPYVSPALSLADRVMTLAACCTRRAHTGLVYEMVNRNTAKVYGAADVCSLTSARRCRRSRRSALRTGP